MAFRGRVNFFFKDPTGKGWSETYFCNESDYTGTMTKAKLLFTHRRNLMGGGVTLNEIRVSDDSVRRDSQIYIPPLADQTSPYVSLWGAADFSDTCLLCRLEGSPLNRRQLYMSALPDSMTTPTGIWAPTPIWNAGFALFATELKNGSWGLNKQSPQGNALDITGYIQTAVTGDLQVTTQNNHAFVIGDLVNVTGNRKTPGVNGRHKVKSVISGTVFSFPLKFFYGGFQGTPKVVKIAFDFARFTEVLQERITEHKRGLPFDRSRGRRLAV